MDTQSLETKVKEALSNGMKVSKKMLSKAGEAVQTFSDKSIIKLERQQLISKQEKKYQELGKKISALMKYPEAQVDYLKKLYSENPETKDLIKEIKTIQEEILALQADIDAHDEQLKADSPKSE